MATRESVARVGALPSAARHGWFKTSTRILGRDWPIGWLFFLPTALLLFGLIGYPFVRALYLSFFNVVGVREGAFVALLLHNLPKWGSVLGGIVLLPYIIPEIVRALAWRILLDPLFGALNYVLVNVLHVMSRGPSWLGDTATTLPSVITVNIWAGMPFFIILILAGLKSIDRELYDAAA